MKKRLCLLYRTFQFPGCGVYESTTSFKQRRDSCTPPSMTHLPYGGNLVARKCLSFKSSFPFRKFLAAAFRWLLTAPTTPLKCRRHEMTASDVLNLESLACLGTPSVPQPALKLLIHMYLISLSIYLLRNLLHLLQRIVLLRRARTNISSHPKNCMHDRIRPHPTIRQPLIRHQLIPKIE